jgi:hypothetical protein
MVVKGNYMPLLLDKFEDKDGLVSTSNIRMFENSMLLEKEEVVEVRELKNLVLYLKKNEYLWQNLKLKLEKKTNLSHSSAPIINISFDEAIEIIISKKQNPVSPRFRLDIEYSEGLICGTLFANFRKNKEEIHFELWQIYHLDKEDIDVPTNYIHGIFDIEEDCFIHFDGALIYHTANDRKSIEQGEVPPKKAQYCKLFRLDCKVTKVLAKEMMSKYLPIEELNQEFGISQSSILKKMELQ